MAGEPYEGVDIRGDDFRPVPEVGANILAVTAFYLGNASFAINFHKITADGFAGFAIGAYEVGGFTIIRLK